MDQDRIEAKRIALTMAVNYSLLIARLKRNGTARSLRKAMLNYLMWSTCWEVI